MHTLLTFGYWLPHGGLFCAEILTQQLASLGTVLSPRPSTWRAFSPRVHCSSSAYQSFS